jgi:hypothetical protein
MFLTATAADFQRAMRIDLDRIEMCEDRQVVEPEQG